MKAKLVTIGLLALLLVGLMPVSADFAHSVEIRVYDVVTLEPVVATVVLTPEVGETFAPREGSNVNIYLQHGAYTVAVTAEGYDVFSDTYDVFDSPAGTPQNRIWEVSLTSATVPNEGTGDGTGDGSNGGTGDGSGNETASESDLVITDVEFEDEVKPAEIVSFEVDLENTGETKADKVEVKVSIISSDSTVEAVEESSRFTLDAGDEKTVTIPVELPRDLDEGDYDVLVNVNWRVDSVIQPTLVHTISDSLTVERAEHDVLVEDVELAQESVAFGERGQVTATFTNIGENDEDVIFAISSAELGISETLVFGLERNDRTTQTVPFTIPEDAEAGAYYATILASYSGTTYTQTVILTAVPTEVNKPTAPVAPVTITLKAVETQSGNPNTVVSALQGDSSTVLGLIVVVIIAIAAIALFAKDFVPVDKKRSRGSK